VCTGEPFGSRIEPPKSEILEIRVKKPKKPRVCGFYRWACSGRQSCAPSRSRSSAIVAASNHHIQISVFTFGPVVQPKERAEIERRHVASSPPARQVATAQATGNIFACGTSMTAVVAFVCLSGRSACRQAQNIGQAITEARYQSPGTGIESL